MPNPPRPSRAQPRLPCQCRRWPDGASAPLVAQGGRGRPPAPRLVGSADRRCLITALNAEGPCTVLYRLACSQSKYQSESRCHHRPEPGTQCSPTLSRCIISPGSASLLLRCQICPRPPDRLKLASHRPSPAELPHGPQAVTINRLFDAGPTKVIARAHRHAGSAITALPVATPLQGSMPPQ